MHACDYYECLTFAQDTEGTLLDFQEDIPLEKTKSGMGVQIAGFDSSTTYALQKFSY